MTNNNNPQTDPEYGNLIRTATGRSLESINLQAVMDNQLAPEDLRIHAETLQFQAQKARQAGYFLLAENFERAAELTHIPDAMVLSIYEALRPHRSTRDELIQLADRLKAEYAAEQVSNFILGAVEIYTQRNLLKNNSITE
jgi:propanediol dehydratase small subunit